MAMCDRFHVKIPQYALFIGFYSLLMLFNEDLNIFCRCLNKDYSVLCSIFKLKDITSIPDKRIIAG